MFIVSITYKVELSVVDSHIDEHIAWLESYYEADKFVASGRKVPRTGGIILVNATEVDEVNLIIKDDPFHIAGVANYEITEFIPTMAAKDFEAIKNCV